jgi:hypothetical protein
LLIASAFYYFFRSFEKRGSNSDIYKLVFVLGIFLYFRAELLALIVIISILFVIRKQYKKAILVLAIPVIMISPWTIRNYVVFGKLVPVSTSGGYNFFIGHGDEAAAEDFKEAAGKLTEDSTFEIRKSHLGYKEGMSYIKSHPMAEVKQSIKKVFHLWIADKIGKGYREPLFFAIWIVTITFFISGLGASLKRPEFRYKMLFLLVHLAFSTAFVVVFYNIPRYQVQMSFIMIPTAAFGFMQFFDMMLVKFKRKT